MDLEEAALLEPFATGLHAVEISDLKAGDGCVIEGPGPIGLSAALSARAMGCTSIVVTGLAQDAERLSLVRDMGFKTVCASDRDWTESGTLVDAARRRRRCIRCGRIPGFCPQTSAARRRAGRARMAGARYPERRDARALFPRCPDSAVTRASRRYMAPCDLIGVERAVKLKQMVTHRYNIEGGIEAFELLR